MRRVLPAGLQPARRRPAGRDFLGLPGPRGLLPRLRGLSLTPLWVAQGKVLPGNPGLTPLAAVLPFSLPPTFASTKLEGVT